MLAEQFSIPSRIVELTDAQSLEWALVENSQRVDVHPYEEAQGFQQLLDIPGYDVAALVEKSGKSASHIYARLSLLQLIPEVVEAFTQERITASHANLMPVCRRSHRPRRSSSAGVRTGRTRNRTCYPPSTFPLGFRTISISSLRMHPSTVKTPPSTPPQELALLAPAAADITLPSSVTFPAINVSYVESGQPQVFSAGSPPAHSQREAGRPPCLFSLDLHPGGPLVS